MPLKSILKLKGYNMHPALIVCICIAVIFFIISIFRMIVDIHEGFVILFLTELFTGLIGFVVVCGLIEWQTEYINVSPDEVESFYHEKNGIVTVTYGTNLYKYTDISSLNSINNIDYYVLKLNKNAYGQVTSNMLVPVAKGKIDDYIREK